MDKVTALEIEKAFESFETFEHFKSLTDTEKKYFKKIMKHVTFPGKEKFVKALFELSKKEPLASFDR